MNKLIFLFPETHMEVISIEYALLAVQGALLGVVTPELRAVVVDVDEKRELLFIRIYYDGKVSSRLIDDWESAITEASAALGPDCTLDEGVERLDYPQEIPLRGRIAYLRRESNACEEKSNSRTLTTVTREIIDFKEEIGIFISPSMGEKVITSWGVIHRANNECHIVPANPKTHQNDIFPLAYIMLALQRALLGVVIPELRTVIADVIDEGKLLYLRFYYHGNIPIENIDDWECAITETIADLGPGYSIDAAIERLDCPKEIPFQGRYAYLRKE